MSAWSLHYVSRPCLVKVVNRAYICPLKIKIMYKDKNRLFRFVLITIAALTTFFCFTSCTPEDQCGTVTGWDIDNQGNYVVYIDGDRHIVMASTWYDAEVGEYMCIEY